MSRRICFSVIRHLCLSFIITNRIITFRPIQIHDHLFYTTFTRGGTILSNRRFRSARLRVCVLRFFKNLQIIWMINNTKIANRRYSTIDTELSMWFSSISLEIVLPFKTNIFFNYRRLSFIRLLIIVGIIAE